MNIDSIRIANSIATEAVDIEESAHRALSEGKNEEAAQRFIEAGSKYEEAATILLDAVENGECDDSIIEDIEQLVEVSKEAKKEAAKALEAKAVKPAKNSKTNTAEDEDVKYKPVSTVPDVSFDDICGLDEAKQIIFDKIINPVRYEALYKAFGIRNLGGILFYGPSGSGKTSLAKAIAKESGFAFFDIRCSDIVSKWFGEAERNIKALFESAYEAGNSVVFFDEAEALFSKRGSNSTVMNRLIPELLSQIDGFNNKPDGHLIIVLGTNRPFDIDPAFLRPGRISAICYVGLPEYETRLEFLRSQMASRPCEEDIDIERIAEITEGYTIADLLNVIDSAAMGPVNRSIAAKKEGRDEDHVITADDVDAALEKIGPSVGEAEVKRLEKWTASRKPGQAQAA